MITQTRDSGYSIRREDVSISDEDIIRRYLGVTELPCSISSPLREDDYRPSFSMREKDGVVFWKDFGTGESGTAVALMAKLWNVSYSEALLQLKLDTENRSPRFKLTRKYNGKVHALKDSTMKVRVRDWKPWDCEFWNNYGISQEFCKWCNVYPVSHAFFSHKNSDGTTSTVTVPMDKYAYAFFEWKDDKESIKLYQPYSTTIKWLSKHDASVWDLWRQAFYYAENVSDDNLIITSSRKDAMCLWENLKIPAVSLQGEGYIPKPHIMEQLKNRFKHIYIWYDNDFSHTNDNPGQDNAKKLVSMFPFLKNICIPSELKCKDPSDLIKTLGKDTLVEVWNNSTTI